MKITIDKKKCIGCGTCSFLAPKVFQLGKDGKAYVLKEEVEPSKGIDEAIGGCPSKAILFKK